MKEAYVSVFVSSIFWVIATQFYSRVGREISIKRLTIIKSWIAVVFFIIGAIFTSTFNYSFEVYLPLILSGLLGFGLGDLFLFYSISHIGPARTMTLNTFQPFIIALFSYLILDISISIYQVIGIVLLGACIFFLKKDKNKGLYPFNLKLGLIAITGISLDGFGLVLSKMAFERSPELNSFSANAIRIACALVFLNIYSFCVKSPLGIKGIPKSSLKQIFLATLLGNCMALLLFLHAISLGNPAVISSLGVLAPVLASSWEHIKMKAYPSIWFMLSIASMAIGIYIIVNFSS